MKTKNQNPQNFELKLGDNLKTIAAYPDNSVHAVIIDGPYGLNSKIPDIQKLIKKYQDGQDYKLGGKGVAGHKWDSDLPTLNICKELLRVLKPGGYLVCFAGSRTYDILVLTLRWAGFQIKDQLIWTYANGLPKGAWLDGQEKDPELIAKLNLSDLNSCLKPAFEPIVLAQKPLADGETILSNVKKYGTGALNIGAVQVTRKDGKERYPANILTDGSKVVSAGFSGGDSNFNVCPFSGLDELLMNPVLHYPKPVRKEKDFGMDEHAIFKTKTIMYGKKKVKVKNSHDTVKPIALMCHLVRLLSRPGDTVVDVFLGSGTTGVACVLEGRKFIGMEIDPGYFSEAKVRIERTQALVEKYKVHDYKTLAVLVELEPINKELDNISKLVLKNPSNREYHAELERLSQRKAILHKAITKLKKAA